MHSAEKNLRSYLRAQKCAFESVIIVQDIKTGYVVDSDYGNGYRVLGVQYHLQTKETEGIEESLRSLGFAKNQFGYTCPDGYVQVFFREDDV